VEQSTRIDVEAPIEQVWRVLREVERWAEWTPTVTSVRRLDDGPLAAGSRVRVEQPRIPPTEYVVTDLVPSRSFTWVATGPGVRTTARNLLEELGTGGTRVTLAGPVQRSRHVRRGRRLLSRSSIHRPLGERACRPLDGTVRSVPDSRVADAGHTRSRCVRRRCGSEPPASPAGAPRGERRSVR
jgi:uncharacterized protein YndB with AHSA1/START domain